MASPPTVAPLGRLCSYTATAGSSPDAGQDAMASQINGGSLLGRPGGALICTLQVNSSNVHSGNVAALRSSGPTDFTGAAVDSGTDVYVSPEDAQNYLCTSYQPRDGMGNLDAADDEARHWAADRESACSLGTPFSTRPTWEASDNVVACSWLQDAHYALGFHRPRLPGEPFYLDHEGDVFVDGDGEATAEADWLFDCPVYIEDGADAADVATGALNTGPATIDR